MKHQMPTVTVNMNNENASVKYTSTALQLFKSSFKKSCQGPISRVLNATQLPGYQTPDQVETVTDNNMFFHKSRDNEEEDSESAVAEEDLVSGEIVKEEAESTDSAP